MKELEWIGSSKKDLMEFPVGVRKVAGHALYIAQDGEKYHDAKPLKGFKGASVLEIRLDDRSGTYRVMYTVQFEEVVYVLHAFQKKSKAGIATPKKEMECLEKRLAEAQRRYAEGVKANRWG